MESDRKIKEWISLEITTQLIELKQQIMWEITTQMLEIKQQIMSELRQEFEKKSLTDSSKQLAVVNKQTQELVTQSSMKVYKAVINQINSNIVPVINDLSEQIADKTMDGDKLVTDYRRALDSTVGGRRITEHVGLYFDETD
jgi:hypothetical protein